MHTTPKAIAANYRCRMVNTNNLHVDHVPRVTPASHFYSPATVFFDVKSAISIQFPISKDGLEALEEPHLRR